MKRRNLLNIALLLLASGSFFWQSCVKDKIDFDKISGTIDYEPQLHVPLLKGSFTIADIYDAQDEDSVLVINGDSIIIYIRQDTIKTLNVQDFIEIPDQGSQHYHIVSPPVDLPFSSTQVYTLVQNDSFEIALEHNMRLDSMLTNSGTLAIEVSSNFSTVGALRITSPALLINNEVFDTIIQFSRPSGDYHRIHDIPLRNAKIIVDNSNPDYPKMEMNFTIVQVVQAGDTIKANSYTDIDFSIRDLEGFDALFGYAGDTSFVQDTIMDIDLGDILEGLSGEFAITNPKININYTHSMGIPIGFDMKIKGYFEDGDSVVLEPGSQNILISPDYHNPEVSSALSFNRGNISNIDQLLVFPPPQRIGYSINVNSNPEGDNGFENYILGDSKLLFGLEIEVPLEFRANLQFRDTFKLEFEDVEDIQYVEYAKLHYTFKNEFPLDIGIKLMLMDSITDTVLDTIYLNKNGNNFFLNAAPVDADGITIRDQVLEIPGVTELSQQQINDLFNVANKVIIVGDLKADNPQDMVYGAVKILSYYSLNFKFGIETKAHYQGSVDSLFNN